MTRKEMYNEIKYLNLGNEIKTKTGKNFTQVSNEQLKKFIDTAVKGIKVPKAMSMTKFDKLADILLKKHILLKSEYTDIMNS